MNPLHWPHKVKLIVAFGVLYVVWGSTYLGIRIGLEAGAATCALRRNPACIGRRHPACIRSRPWHEHPHPLGRVPHSRHRRALPAGRRNVLHLPGRAQHPSGLAALIRRTPPLWMALAESFLPGMERPSTRGVVGLVIGFSGLVI